MRTTGGQLETDGSGVKAFTDEELKSELARREAEKNSAPSLVASPNFVGVVKMVESFKVDIQKAADETDPFTRSSVAESVLDDLLKALYGDTGAKWFLARLS